jgi:hypothetical protein
MTHVLGFQIGVQLDYLKHIIQSHNKQGDIYGLFSYRILGQTLEFKMEWAVACDPEWLRSFDDGNMNDLASLGYSISFQDDPEAQARFTKSFLLFKKRVHFKGPHISFPFQPLTFLGMVLGAKSFKDIAARQDALAWLISILDKRYKIGQLLGFSNLLYKYIEHHL